MKINPTYKKMCETAFEFQQKYKDKVAHPIWTPRLASLVALCENDVEPAEDQVNYGPAYTMADVINIALRLHYQDKGDGASLEELTQEQMYLSYLMYELFDKKWCSFLNTWIKYDETIIQYCTKMKINLYATCVDPAGSGNILSKEYSLDLQTLLDKSPLTNRKVDILQNWVILNAAYYNHVLYKFDNFKENWNKYQDEEK